jgi:hypothetical protein
MCYGADTSLSLINALNFTVSNFKSYLSWTYGAIVSGSNFPSFGDSTIDSGSEFNGCCNNATSLGTGGYQAGVIAQGGVGLRIINNKFNYGVETATTRILLEPSYGSQSQEPVIIANNSIEGGNSCVGMERVSSSATIDLAIIASNEMWCGINTIYVNNNGTGQWVAGLNVTGNHLQINGVSGATIVNMDNVGGGTFTGNNLGCSGGCSTTTGWNLGAHTTNINVQSNSYAAGITTKVNNAGTGNVVGGGSD